MNSDFEGLLGKLVEGGVEFVLVGGYSAMLHGSSLMTQDIDVVCPLGADNLARLFDVLEDSNPIHRMVPSNPRFVRDDVTKGGWQNLYLRTDLGVLDCLGEVRGIGNYEDCLARSIEIQLDSFSIRGLSIEALIEAKRAMGRPRDIETAEQLEIIRRKKKG